MSSCAQNERCRVRIADLDSTGNAGMVRTADATRRAIRAARRSAPHPNPLPRVRGRGSMACSRIVAEMAQSYCRVEASRNRRSESAQNGRGPRQDVRDEMKWLQGYSRQILLARLRRHGLRIMAQPDRATAGPMIVARATVNHWRCNDNIRIRLRDYKASRHRRLACVRESTHPPL
ncbi:MAG: hypothetical protein JWL69_1299 [Phycisphaerales bacterium]|nr:hypothetical protein [Phycisphaerales bacterium]